jgi:hypothetical protein
VELRLARRQMKARCASETLPRDGSREMRVTKIALTEIFVGENYRRSCFEAS